MSHHRPSARPVHPASPFTLVSPARASLPRAPQVALQACVPVLVGLQGAMAAHRAALLLDEEELRRVERRGTSSSAGPARRAGAEQAVAAFGEESDDAEEYVPVAKRRALETQGRYQRLGRAGASAEAAGKMEAPTQHEQPVERASLLVRAAELKKDKPVEDESAKLAREELEILRSITVRHQRPIA